MSQPATDRKRWEERHGRSLESMSLEPAELLVDFTEHLSETPGGKALDIGTGNGRNAFFLASLGYEVTAIDFSSPAVRFVQHRAAELSVGVDPVQADIADFDLGQNRYAVITNFLFLDRNVVPRIVRSLVPGGLLFFETFTVEHRDVLGNEIRRDYCLEPNEALHLFAPLHVIYYREGVVTPRESVDRPRATAQLIARRVAAALSA